jgi:hypothetical protein
MSGMWMFWSALAIAGLVCGLAALSGDPPPDLPGSSLDL